MSPACKRWAKSRARLSLHVKLTLVTTSGLVILGALAIGGAGGGARSDHVETSSRAYALEGTCTDPPCASIGLRTAKTPIRRFPMRRVRGTRTAGAAFAKRYLSEPP